MPNGDAMLSTGPISVPFLLVVACKNYILYIMTGLDEESTIQPLRTLWALHVPIGAFHNEPDVTSLRIERFLKFPENQKPEPQTKAYVNEWTTDLKSDPILKFPPSHFKHCFFAVFQDVSLCLTLMPFLFQDRLSLNICK